MSKDTVSTEERPQVPPEGGTQEVPGVVEGEKTMPGTPVGDEEVDYKKLYEEQAAKIEQIRIAADRDINQLKSSLQRGEAQRLKEAEERENTLREQLRDLQRASMTEVERAKFDVQIAKEERERVERQLQELQGRQAQQDAYVSAKDFFVQAGVPLDTLRDATSVEEVVQSGYQAMFEELQSLRKKVVEAEKAPQSGAPQVHTKKGTGEGAVPTLLELAKKYGSVEEVFKQAESGRLDGNLLIPPDNS